MLDACASTQRALTLTRSSRCSLCRDCQLRFGRNITLKTDRRQNGEKRERELSYFWHSTRKRGLRVFIRVSESGERAGQADARGHDSTESSLDVGDEVYYQFRLRSHGERSQAAALTALRDVEVVSQ